MAWKVGMGKTSTSVKIWTFLISRHFFECLTLILNGKTKYIYYLFIYNKKGGFVLFLKWIFPWPPPKFQHKPDNKQIVKFLLLILAWIQGENSETCFSKTLSQKTHTTISFEPERAPAFNAFFFCFVFFTYKRKTALIKQIDCCHSAHSCSSENKPP